jgi:hypothetical protein
MHENADAALGKQLGDSTCRMEALEGIWNGSTLKYLINCWPKVCPHIRKAIMTLIGTAIISD